MGGARGARARGSEGRGAHARSAPPREGGRWRGSTQVRGGGARMRSRLCVGKRRGGGRRGGWGGKCLPRSRACAAREPCGRMRGAGAAPLLGGAPASPDLVRAPRKLSRVRRGWRLDG